MVIEGVDTTGRHKTHNLDWRLGDDSVVFGAWQIQSTWAVTPSGREIPDASFSVWLLSRCESFEKVQMRSSVHPSYFSIVQNTSLAGQSIESHLSLGKSSVFSNISSITNVINVSADFRWTKMIFHHQIQHMLCCVQSTVHRVYNKCVPLGTTVCPCQSQSVLYVLCWCLHRTRHAGAAVSWWEQLSWVVSATNLWSLLIFFLLPPDTRPLHPYNVFRGV